MTTIKEQYYEDKSKLDSKDVKDIEYLLEFEKEHSDNEF